MMKLSTVGNAEGRREKVKKVGKHGNITNVVHK
jgi:hypothetical protein